MAAKSLQVKKGGRSFNPAAHPRDANGRFAPKSGGASKAKSSGKKTAAASATRKTSKTKGGLFEKEVNRASKSYKTTSAAEKATLAKAGKGGKTGVWGRASRAKNSADYNRQSASVAAKAVKQHQDKIKAAKKTLRAMERNAKAGNHSANDYKSTDTLIGTIRKSKMALANISNTTRGRIADRTGKPFKAARGASF